MMRTQPLAPSEASPSERAPLYAFAVSLEPLGLPQGAVERLFLRFETMGPLRTSAAPMPATVGVLATWRQRSLRSGAVDHVRALPVHEAQALLHACDAADLPVVNNLPPERR